MLRTAEIFCSIDSPSTSHGRVYDSSSSPATFNPLLLRRWHYTGSGPLSGLHYLQSVLSPTLCISRSTHSCGKLSPAIHCSRQRQRQIRCETAREVWQRGTNLTERTEFHKPTSMERLVYQSMPSESAERSSDIYSHKPGQQQLPKQIVVDSPGEYFST